MREVSASILSDNPFKLIDKLNSSNANYIHLDIVDNKFVPNNKFLTVSEMVKILEKIKKKIDVHLMVKNPEPYIKKLSLYDVSYITIHYEITDFMKYVNMIKRYGLKAGVAIKPETKIEEIFPFLKDLSLILIMSVEPGFSGQSFITDTKDKVSALKKEIIRQKVDTKISVDGGINDLVLPYVTDADILVSCSYINNNLDNIEKLKN